MEPRGVSWSGWEVWEVGKGGRDRGTGVLMGAAASSEEQRNHLHAQGLTGDTRAAMAVGGVGSPSYS